MSAPGRGARPGIDDLAAAWQWVVWLRADQASQGDLAEWLRWYEADERHKQAFEEMQAFWHESGRLVDASRGMDAAQLLAGTAASPRSRRTDRGRRRRWHAPALAATLVACALALGWVSHHRSVVVETATPAIVRETQLADGSKVEMAARSTVTAHYTPSERVLDMAGPSGEAFFSVAKNPSRPFIVQVGEMRVRAVGTAFNIRRVPDRVVVTVTEGVIEVYWRQQHPAEKPLRVSAGHRVVWGEAGDIEPAVTPVDSTRALAWQKGRLEYVNEPLGAVIADVNRYARRPVSLGDEGIGAILFSGTVFTSETDAWVRALPEVFPVELLERPDAPAVLVRRTGHYSAP